MNETKSKNNTIDDYCKNCARYNECNLIINDISEQIYSTNKVQNGIEFIECSKYDQTDIYNYDYNFLKCYPNYKKKVID